MLLSVRADRLTEGTGNDKLVIFFCTIYNELFYWNLFFCHRRFPLSLFFEATPKIAILSASVPEEVKKMSSLFALISDAIISRDFNNTCPAFCPIECKLEEFP